MNGGDVRYKRDSGVGDKHLYGIDGLYRHPNQHHKNKDKTFNNILGFLYLTILKSCGNRAFNPHGILQDEVKYNSYSKLFFYLHTKIDYKLISKWEFRETNNLSA